MIDHQTKFKETEIGSIPEEWDVFDIETIAEVIGGGTPSTKEENNFGGSIAWITPHDLSNYQDRYILQGERNITETGLDNSSAKILPAGTVLLTTRAPVGYLVIAKNEVTTNQGFHSLIPKKGIDNLFLFYLLKNNVQKLIDNASGSTFQELSGKALKSLEFAFPKEEEQKRIAEILGALDEMIELNRRMNESLEKIASTIFKHWFVDYDFPNEQGKPYKSTGGKMIESELGLIPEGWSIVSLSDIFAIFGGGTPRTDNDSYWNGEIPFFTPKDTNNPTYTLKTQKNISETGLKNCNSRLFPKNTTFITARGTVGEIALAGLPMAMNQSCYAIAGKEEVGQYFTYLQIKRSIQDLKNKTHGSVFQTITTETFNNSYATISNNKQITNLFELTVQPLFDQILENSIANEKLAQIRDSLLPRLMSGKIRVNI